MTAEQIKGDCSEPSNIPHMIRCLNILILLYLSKGSQLLATETLSIPEEWQHQFDEITQLSEQDGIETWKLTSGTRDYYGSFMNLPYSKSTIESILYDNTRFPEWLPQTTEIHELEKSSDSSWILYCVTDAPWPFRDRQSVIKLSSQILGNGDLCLSFNLAHYPGYQMDPNRESLKTLDGFWLIKAETFSSCKVAYVLHVGMTGSIPEKMQRSFYEKLPCRSLCALNSFLSQTQTRVYEFAQDSNTGFR